jgi:hypothetical protein
LSNICIGLKEVRLLTGKQQAALKQRAPDKETWSLIGRL